MADIFEIDAEKLNRMKTLHVAFLLIDVRDAYDFAENHIDGAINLPADDFDEFLNALTAKVPKKDTPIVIYDDDGTWSAQIVEAAEQGGFINVVNLQGGLKGYLDAGYRTGPLS